MPDFDLNQHDNLQYHNLQYYFNLMRQPLLQITLTLKETSKNWSAFYKTGNVLLSQAVARQVSSALRSLTAVFEMGTGVPSPLLSPDLSLENYSSLHVLFLQKPLVKLSTY